MIPHPRYQPTHGISHYAALKTGLRPVAMPIKCLLGLVNALPSPLFFSSSRFVALPFLERCLSRQPVVMLQPTCVESAGRDRFEHRASRLFRVDQRRFTNTGGPEERNSLRRLEVRGQVSFADVAEDVFGVVRALALDDLYAGSHAGGYVEPSEAAWEVIENAVTHDVVPKCTPEWDWLVR